MSTSRFSPKYVFLWLAAMITLYISIGSSAVLLFNYIDILFPDKLVAGYYDPYSGAVRFAIASLVVVFPLYLLLMRMVHRDIRADAERAELGVRKWLVYLTIFAAAAFLAGALIALINTFLNGEITTRFLLKLIVVFVLAGSTFWYYIEELRGVWQTNEQRSKYVGMGTAILVLVAIVSGFFLIGTPGDARAYRFDERRVQDLESLQYQLVDYYRAKREVPVSLDALIDTIGTGALPTDPDTGEQYDYRRTSSTAFELCATFARSSGERKSTRPWAPMPGIQGADWTHEAGTHCFSRTIDPELYPPLSDTAREKERSGAAVPTTPAIPKGAVMEIE